MAVSPLDVEFPDDSHSFFAGFEMGVMWMRLHLEPAPVHATVHAINREALHQMGLATGFRAVWGEETPATLGCPLPTDLVDVTMMRAH